MTLREHFEAIERKLDQLVGLLAERRGADPLNEAEKLMAEVKQRFSRLEERRGSSRGSGAPASAPPPIRLLVEENGERLWRTVEGRCLIGSCGPDGELAVMGRWTKTEGPRTDFYAIQTLSGKFVIYKRPADSPVGTIEIAQDLAALEKLLPPDLYQEAIQRAVAGARCRRRGYPELPLEGA